MKILFVAGAVLFLTSQFLCRAQAVELCEPQDYYNLAGSIKCSIKNNKAGDKNESRELMFEVLKNYPYEGKESFIKVLQRKIELVDDYAKKEQGKRQTGKAAANISMLEQTKQSLSDQLGLVKAATRDNWVGVRDRARKALEEAASRLRGVE